MFHFARQPYGWVPLTFIGLFLIVVAVNGVLVYFASVSWSGLETRDYFAKGIAYNQTLAEARAQAALGWRLEGRFTEGRVEATLRDAGGAALDGAEVRVRFVRPTREGYDREAALQGEGGGVYGAPMVLPLAGQWDMRLVAHRDGRDYRQIQRIYVTP